MAVEYNENKLTKLSALKALAEKIKEGYAKQSDLTALSGKVSALETAGGEKNKIEKIKVNGQDQTITSSDRSVNITVPQNVTDLTDGGDYAKTADVEEKINTKISSVYKPGGSLESADTTKLIKANVGTVYNISAKFNTDAEHFVEGVGKNYPAGTNVVVVEDGSETYKFDVLAGFVDLTSYATTQSLAAGLAKKAEAEHKHGVEDITDLEDTLSDYATTTSMTAALAGKQDKGNYVTNETLTTELAKKQAVGDYATKTELDEKADEEHSHTMSEITDLELATPEEVSAMLEEVFTAE